MPHTAGKGFENDEQGYTETCYLIFRIEFLITYQVISNSVRVDVFVFFSAVVLKLGSTEPQGFGEAVAGVRLRSE